MGVPLLESWLMRFGRRWDQQVRPSQSTAMVSRRSSTMSACPSPSAGGSTPRMPNYQVPVASESCSAGWFRWRVSGFRCRRPSRCFRVGGCGRFRGPCRVRVCRRSAQTRPSPRRSSPLFGFLSNVVENSVSSAFIGRSPLERVRGCRRLGRSGVVFGVDVRGVWSDVGAPICHHQTSRSTR